MKSNFKIGDRVIANGCKEDVNTLNNGKSGIIIEIDDDPIEWLNHRVAFKQGTKYWYRENQLTLNNQK